MSFTCFIFKFLKLKLNVICTLNDACIDYASCSIPYGSSAFSCNCLSAYYPLNGVCGKLIKVILIFKGFF